MSRPVTRVTALAGFLFLSFAIVTAVRSAQPEFFAGTDLRANPRDSSAWIALGLAAESRGEFNIAETDLREAVRVDHQYLPAWTLANYGFRQRKPQLFWPAAARAAALSETLSSEDLGPLIRLADTMEPNARKAVDQLGAEPRLERAYLDFLIGDGNLDGTQSLALGMARDSSNVPRLLDLVEREIQAQQARPAIVLWNRLAEAKLIPFTALYPERGAILTDGGFLEPPLGQAFGWRLLPNAAIQSDVEHGELQISLSGDQPETCPLAEQVVPAVSHSRRYRLEFDYQTTGLASPSGIRWALGPQEETGSLRKSNDWTAEQIDFRPPPGGLATLRLLYRREPGTVPARGSMSIRRLRLEVS